MQNLTGLTAFLAANLDLVSTLKFIGILVIAMVILGFIGKAIFGSGSSLNQALSLAMGILCVYALTIVVYTFNPSGLSKFLAPLPFVTFRGETLYIFSIAGADFPTVCSQVLSMVILAFLVNMMDSIMPKGKHLLGWFFYRFLTVVLAMALHYIVVWIFNTFMPGTMVTYAPMILLGTLVIMVFLGLLKAILGLVLTLSNPLLGGLYAFFFSNKIGKQVSKALLTTLILAIFVYSLNYFGYSTISISAAALQSYIPLIVALLFLWYLIGYVL